MTGTPWDWNGYRVVVLDLETTAIGPSVGEGEIPDEYRFRVVDIAAVTIREGRIRSRWSELVNPQVQIDSKSYEIHTITDRDVHNAVTFADIEPIVTRLLTSNNDEQVIVVAHKTNFDVPILRAEYARIGLEIPDFALIDTLIDLPELSGAAQLRKSKGLTETCRALGVTRANAHTAAGDAESAAQIFLRMLDLAVEQGYRSFDQLLADLPPERSVDIEASVPSLDDRAFTDDLLLPDDHVRSHDLRYQPVGTVARDWLNGAIECVDLRCPHLRTKREVAREAGLDRKAGLDVLNMLLSHAASTEDAQLRGPMVATVLGAFSEDIIDLWSPSEKASSPYTAVIHWAAEWQSLFDSVTACDTVRCPDCRAGRTCPTEMWQEWLAHRLFATRSYRPKGQRGTGTFDSGGEPAKTLYDSVVRRESRRHMPSTLAALRRAGLPTVADHLLGLVFERLTADGYQARAEAIEDEAWGYHHARGPRLAAQRAKRVATANDLDAAIDICTEVLEGAECPPGPARRQLAATLVRLLRDQAARDFRQSAAQAPPAVRSRINAERKPRRLFG